MRIGLDVHGVITADPQFFSDFSKYCRDQGDQVFVITGSMSTPQLTKQLDGFNIYRDQVYSITDYQLKKGTFVSFDEKGNPWIEEETWNKTKAILCKIYKVDIHIDDSFIYGKYFSTPYILYKMGEFKFQNQIFSPSTPSELYQIIS